MKSATEKGTIAEYQFCVRAMQHGLAVCLPTVDVHGYDLITENSHGNFYRIQVKFSDYMRKLDGNLYQTFTLHKTPPNIDFFALYSLERVAFYIIPAQLLIGVAKVSIRIDEAGRWEIYKSAFNQLQQ